MSESTVKIHLVSMHDDTGFRSVVKNTKEAERTVSESLKRQLEARKNLEDEVAKANQSAVGSMQDVAKGAEAAIQAANGNAIQATKSILGMAKASNTLAKAMAAVGSVRMGIWGAVIAIVMKLYNWMKETEEECAKLVHESRMASFDQLARHISVVAELFRDATREATSLRKAEDELIATQREMEDTQMRLDRAREISGISSEDEKARHEVELRNRELQKELEYRRKIEDEERKIARIRENVQEMHTYRSRLVQSQKKVLEDIHLMEIESDRSEDKNKELERLYSMREQLYKDINDLDNKMTDSSRDIHSSNARIEALKSNLQREREIINADEDDYQATREEELQRQLEKQSEEEEEAVRAMLEKEEKERAEAEERMLQEYERFEQEKERIAKEATRRAIADEIKMYQDEMAQRQQMLSDANARLQAARSGSAKAWSWFRDRDSLKNALEEQRANAEAEKDYQRQFERLKSFRKDWRTANAYGSGGMRSLTLDEEAVRQVALSREEEENAQKAVTECRDSLAWIKDHLEQIESMKE